MADVTSSAIQEAPGEIISGGHSLAVVVCAPLPTAKVLADSLVGRLGAMLDLGQKPVFGPDSLVSDALGMRPGLSDKGFKPLSQISGRDLIAGDPQRTGLKRNESKPLTFL